MRAPHADHIPTPTMQRITCPNYKIYLALRDGSPAEPAELFKRFACCSVCRHDGVCAA
jgi:hypothetical protein